MNFIISPSLFPWHGKHVYNKQKALRPWIQLPKIGFLSLAEILEWSSKNNISVSLNPTNIWWLHYLKINDELMPAFQSTWLNFLCKKQGREAQPNRYIIETLQVLTDRIFSHPLRRWSAVPSLRMPLRHAMQWLGSSSSEDCDRIKSDSTNEVTGKKERR